MRILLIYPSGNEHVEEVPDIEHARHMVDFGGEAYVLGDDGARTPLADRLSAHDAAQADNNLHAGEQA